LEIKEGDRVMYDFKIYLPTSDSDSILVFHAWIADKESYYLREVPKFGIHETYKKLFIDMLNGTLQTTDILINDNGEVEYIENSIASSCGNEISEVYFNCCQEYLKNKFEVITKVESFKMHPMFDLRYDAPDMNLEYGISPNISKKLYSFTNELVDVIQANNTNYGGVLQQQAQAGSTVIPYLSEKIDTNANAIIKQVIDDINNGNINRDFANSNNHLAPLYKKIVKKMTELKRIKDLETFEIFIYNENGEKEKKDVDLSKIGRISSQLFGDYIQKRGMVRIPAYPLKSKQSIYSATIVIDDKDFSVHLDMQNESFERLKRILKENEGREVIIEGYKEAEYTILASHISIVVET